MPAARECICEEVQCIVTMLHRLNADLFSELRIESRVSRHGIATLLLKCHLDKPKTWKPMANWSCCLEPLDKLEISVLLEH